MDPPLRSPGQSGATHLLQRSLSLGHSFPVAARAPIAISVFALSRSRKATGSPGCRMCEGQKLSRTRTADITMEPARSFDCVCRQATASASLDDLITPGSFEFELLNRPSVLIFSMEGLAKAQRNQHVGAFLSGLIQDDSVSRTNLGATRGPRQERARSSSPHDHEPGVFHVRDKSCAKYCWPAPRALRSNRMIDRALREAYRKYDRTEQTQKLLRQYLLG